MIINFYDTASLSELSCNLHSFLQLILGKILD